MAIADQGFEAVMAGARERLSGDDAVLDETSTVLVSKYAHLVRESRRANDKASNR